MWGHEAPKLGRITNEMMCRTKERRHNPGDRVCGISPVLSIKNIFQFFIIKIVFEPNLFYYGFVT